MTPKATPASPPPLFRAAPRKGHLPWGVERSRDSGLTWKYEAGHACHYQAGAESKADRLAHRHGTRRQLTLMPRPVPEEADVRSGAQQGAVAKLRQLGAKPRQRSPEPADPRPASRRAAVRKNVWIIWHPLPNLGSRWGITYLMEAVTPWETPLGFAPTEERARIAAHRIAMELRIAADDIDGITAIARS